MNRRVYGSPRTVAAYAAVEIAPAEQAVLDRFAGELEGRRVLELGCGTGRVTRHLLPSAREVVGVDVSPAMVERCRGALPEGTFLVGDLRDLSAHADASFDVAVAAANVFDALSHEERLTALSEARRVLAPGGLLYFSSHNRASTAALRQAREGPLLRLEGGPARRLRALVAFVHGRLNHRRLARHQRFEGDYAILNDEAHRWRLLHYYVDRRTQAAQLDGLGFDLVLTLGPDGEELPEGDEGAGFTELHYVARAR